MPKALTSSLILQPYYNKNSYHQHALRLMPAQKDCKYTTFLGFGTDILLSVNKLSTGFVKMILCIYTRFSHLIQFARNCEILRNVLYLLMFRFHPESPEKDMYSRQYTNPLVIFRYSGYEYNSPYSSTHVRDVGYGNFVGLLCY